MGSLPRNEAPVDLRSRQAGSRGAGGGGEGGDTSGTIIRSIGRKPAGALRWEGRAREAAAGEAGIWGGESGREGEEGLWEEHGGSVNGD
jgi:hypothetical protein